MGKDTVDLGSATREEAAYHNHSGKTFALNTGLLSNAVTIWGGKMQCLIIAQPS